MNIEKVYTQVYEILEILGDEYISKIPIELYENIKNNRDKQYITNIDIDMEFNEENLSQEALELLAFINMEYWVDDTKKDELNKKYRKIYENVKGLDDIEKIFKKRAFSENNIDNIKSVEIIKYKNSFLNNLLNKIKKLLKK